MRDDDMKFKKQRV